MQFIGRAGIVAAALLAAGCARGSANAPAEAPSPISPAVAGSADNQPKAQIKAQVDEFCGACHTNPDPADFPKSQWRREVDQGYQFYFASNRTDLALPVKADVIDYYQRLAPDEIELPASVDDGGIQQPLFTPLEGPAANEPLAVAGLSWMRLFADGPQRLIVCDMRTGAIDAAVIRPSSIEFQHLARLEHPARAAPCDLNQDGRMDLVVADLGSYPPSDHDLGRVVWLRRSADEEAFTPIVLADRLGRVADVQPLDFDGDGDTDLVVAEFGWRSTGRLLALENTALEDGVPQFQLRVIDPRHGVIHVPVADVNGDQRPDFFALFAQEHEAVELFLNRGGGEFEAQRLYAADRPTFGSSGISLVDLDADGDLDVLLTNGDMFDSFHLRTFHAIHWLENCGPGNWKHHEIAQMPGVHRALAADLDLDGDLDIAACALIPDQVLQSHRGLRLDSLIWLEQTSSGKFQRRALEVNQCNHAALELGDFDGDGDVDLAVGNYATSKSQRLPRITVWWSQSADRRSRPGSVGAP